MSNLINKEKAGGTDKDEFREAPTVEKNVLTINLNLESPDEMEHSSPEPDT